MNHFRFSEIVTMIIPGAFLTTAIAVLWWRFDSRSGIALWASISEYEWLAAVGVLVACATLGTSVSSAWTWIERESDRRRASELNIDSDQYSAEWDRYVDSLERAKNAYIDRLVLFWRFESRTGLSLVLLFLSIYSAGVLPILGCLVLVLGLWLLYASRLSHCELAKYRHRRFPRDSFEDIKRRLEGLRADQIQQLRDITEAMENRNHEEGVVN
jgi:hypothetical protein